MIESIINRSQLIIIFFQDLLVYPLFSRRHTAFVKTSKTWEFNLIEIRDHVYQSG